MVWASLQNINNVIVNDNNLYTSVANDGVNDTRSIEIAATPYTITSASVVGNTIRGTNSSVLSGVVFQVQSGTLVNAVTNSNTFSTMKRGVFFLLNSASALRGITINSNVFETLVFGIVTSGNGDTIAQMVAQGNIFTAVSAPITFTSSLVPPIRILKDNIGATDDMITTALVKHNTVHTLSTGATPIVIDSLSLGATSQLNNHYHILWQVESYCTGGTNCTNLDYIRAYFSEQAWIHFANTLALGTSMDAISFQTSANGIAVGITAASYTPIISGSNVQLRFTGPANWNIYHAVYATVVISI
jgi:hypothetical protein